VAGRREDEAVSTSRSAAGRPVEAWLAPHPAAPLLPRLRVRVATMRTTAGELSLRYVLEAPLATFRIPERARAPGRRDGLWRHTCFEAFVASAPGGAYHEINLSPSEDWAIYAFRAYREPAPPAPAGAAPIVTTAASPGRFELAASVRLGALDASYERAPVFVGLSAVIEAADGSLSYLALCHPAEEPDFHDARGFTLRLDPPI